MHPISTQLLQAWSMPSMGELLLVLLIVVVVFGHNRIPALGEALGKGIRNFRKSFAKDDEPVKAPAGDLTDARSTLPSPALDQKQSDANKIL